MEIRIKNIESIKDKIQYLDLVLNTGTLENGLSYRIDINGFPLRKPTYNTKRFIEISYVVKMKIAISESHNRYQTLKKVLEEVESRYSFLRIRIDLTGETNDKFDFFLVTFKLNKNEID